MKKTEGRKSRATVPLTYITEVLRVLFYLVLVYCIDIIIQAGVRQHHHRPFRPKKDLNTMDTSYNFMFYILRPEL
jgi:hypothetical protein